MLPMKTTPIKYKIKAQHTKYFRLVFYYYYHTICSTQHYHTICSNTTIITHDQGAKITTHSRQIENQWDVQAPTGRMVEAGANRPQ